MPCSTRCGPKDCTQHEFGPYCENRNCTVGNWSDRDGNICDQKTKEDDNDNCVRKRIQVFFYDKYHYYRLTYKRTRRVLFGSKGIGSPCPNLEQNITCEYKKCETHFFLSDLG